MFLRTTNEFLSNVAFIEPVVRCVNRFLPVLSFFQRGLFSFDHFPECGQKISLPANVSIKSDVSIGPLAGKPGAFGIAVAMAITVPGMDKPTAEELVKAAHEVCPYSNATRGNVDVALTVV